MSPGRVQLKRTKGWRMPANTVKVTRPGPWGNPYPNEVFGLQLALTLFRNSMQGVWSPGVLDGKPADLVDLAYRLHVAFLARHHQHPLENARATLAGKKLACFCPLSQSCHVDILLECANPG
jgi:hypothetical protein